MVDRLNQPSSVQEYSLIGFKLLLCESKVGYVYPFASIARKRTG